MKKKFLFTSGEVKLFIAKSVEIHADTLEEAEDHLVEHLRQYGEVYSASSFAQEDIKD